MWRSSATVFARNPEPSSTITSRLERRQALARIAGRHPQRHARGEALESAHVVTPPQRTGWTVYALDPKQAPATTKKSPEEQLLPGLLLPIRSAKELDL